MGPFSERTRTTIVPDFAIRYAAETDSTQPPNANRQHLVSPGCASPTFKMRTYDDSFSGQKIYPGKVRSIPLFQYRADRQKPIKSVATKPAKPERASISEVMVDKPAILSADSSRSGQFAVQLNERKVYQLRRTCFEVVADRPFG